MLNEFDHSRIVGTTYPKDLSTCGEQHQNHGQADLKSIFVGLFDPLRRVHLQGSYLAEVNEKDVHEELTHAPRRMCYLLTIIQCQVGQ